MAESQKTRAEMIGEALREAGVLAAVFIPLDHVFAEHPVLPAWATLLAMLVVGGGLFTLGLLIEERRK
jgi:hypothetical protein